MKHKLNRKERTVQVLRRLNDGPHFIGREQGLPMNLKDYKLWVDTWIIPELWDLIPEARNPQIREAGEHKETK